MNTKTIIPLVLGLGVGGFAIKIVVDVVKEAQGATQANMVQCVVAKTNIDFAAEVTPDQLAVRDWPKDSLPQQHFSSIEDLKARVTSMHIPKDVPIYPSMLAPPGTPPGIQTRIKPGYRAVTVAIDEITGVAYQLQPGDTVDVMSLVRRNTSEGGTDYASRIILQNVEIAAVGRTLDTGRTGQTPQSIARSVTLLLKPDEATRLHLAQTSRGKISLALRGTNDEGEPVEIAAASDDALRDQPDEAPPAPPIEPTPVVPVVQQLAAAPVKSQMPEPASWVVRVISGNDIRLVEYVNDHGRWVPTDQPRKPAADGLAALPTLATDRNRADDFGDSADPDYGDEHQSAEE